MGKIIFFISFFIISLFLLSSIVTGTMLETSTKNQKSLVQQTRTDVWIEALQANFNNPQWFYNNLNGVDRLKIRLALDYATPRQYIINNIIGGFGYPLATTDLPQSGSYFNGSIQPRTYSLSLASQLLTQVFGYTYSLTDNPNTPYDESLPYFPIGAIVPNDNPERAQWAEYIQFQYKSIGVEVSTMLLTNSQITQRIFNNIAVADFDFSHGGYDGLFIKWTDSFEPNDGYAFYSSNSTASVGNYQFVNATDLDKLINAEDNASATQTQLYSAYNAVQQYLYNNVIRNVLFQTKDLYVFNSHLKGFDPFYATSPHFSDWSYDNGQTTLIVAIPEVISNFNPLMTKSLYGNYYLSEVWPGNLMTVRNPDSDLTYTKSQLYNNFADWYNVSSDGYTYFFNLKSGLTFQDGSPITSKDVKFTYLSCLTPEIGCNLYSTLSKQLNNNSITTFLSNSTLIKFQLTKLDPLTMTKLWSLPILPSNQYSQISYANWKTDQTNTGTNSSAIVGTGPYKFNGFSNNNGSLIAWSGWNTSYDLKFSNLPLNSHGVPAIQNITIVKINDANVALTDLENNEVDFGDTNIGFSPIFSQVKSSGLDYQNSTGLSWQEFGLNQVSPIWGLCPIDPSVLYSGFSTTVKTVTLYTSSSVSQSSGSCKASVLPSSSTLSSSSTSVSSSSSSSAFPSTSTSISTSSELLSTVNPKSPFSDLSTIIFAISVNGITLFFIRRKRKN